MRTIFKTDEFTRFYDSLDQDTKEKIEYILYLIETLPWVHSRFMKKLVGTPYYEVRISVDNEYRILVSMDQPLLSQAKRVLLINGFQKKSTKDYKAQIARADKIINGLTDETED